jgi:hypothetical protein
LTVSSYLSQKQDKVEEKRTVKKSFIFNFIRQKWSIITVVALLLVQLPINAEVFTKSQASPKTPQSNTKERKIDFSGTGRPGKQTAGENRGGCPSADNHLTALIPISNLGKTVKAHPSFWVYIPYNKKQIQKAEFVLQTAAREDVWRSPVNLEDRSSYLNLELPKTIPPLKIGNWYRWYLKVFCNSTTLASPKFVQGWISRIAIESGLNSALVNNPQQDYSIYVEHGIWYDAIDLLLKSYQQDPNNPMIRQDWQNLLEAKGVNLKLPALDLNDR